MDAATVAAALTLRCPADSGVDVAALHPYLDHPGPIALAHRGGTEAATENSMEAFSHAIETLGYRYLETDAHATKDGVLVAFHDDRLDRVTDRMGQISELTWAEIKGVRMAGGEQIPLLEDLMTAWPHVRLNIDPKTDAAASLLPDVIDRVGFELDRLCLGAFSDKRLAGLRQRLGAGLCTSMGPLSVLRLRLNSWGLPRFGSFAAKCCQVPVADKGIPVADGRFIEAAHRLGLQVHVWTINEEAEMRRLLDLGVDGLVTDRPGLLKRVLESRGEWS